MKLPARRGQGPHGDAGATAVEYALIVFAIAAVIVAIVFLLGGTVKKLFNNSCASINSQGSVAVASSDCG